MKAEAPPALETVSVDVPGHALEAYEAALSSCCRAVGFFLDEPTGIWRVEGVRAKGDDGPLLTALVLAAALTGVEAPLSRANTEAGGWLARTAEAFPQIPIGATFAIRGTHETAPALPGRITLTLDAGVAFGSGEHASTQGCLVALETIRHARTIIDIGTGSGILAMAAAKRFPAARVTATDNDPFAVRVARENFRRNTVRGDVRLADGWTTPGLPHADLVFANILARPLCAMARGLTAHLAHGGTAILSGLLRTQARQVLAAHRRQGLRLRRALHVAGWTTLVVTRAATRPTLQPH